MSIPLQLPAPSTRFGFACKVWIAYPVDMFRPQLWRLDLSKVEQARWDRRGANPTWDEQFVADLKDDEFSVCVE